MQRIKLTAAVPIALAIVTLWSQALAAQDRSTQVRPAQNPPPARDTAQPRPPALPGLTTSAEFGARSFLQDVNDRQLGKFTEYKSTPSGAVLKDLLIGYTTPDSVRDLVFTAHNVGQIDQSVGARFSQPGFLDARFNWDRIPHTFSSTARILGTRPRVDYFSLAGAPRGDTGSVNSALNAVTSYMGPVRTSWTPLKFGLAFTPTHELDTKLEYTRIAKLGDRPLSVVMGSSPGNNSREILEPIDQTTHDFKVSQSYATEQFQLVGSYNLSVFRNAFQSVSADNPLGLATDGTPTITSTSITSVPSLGRMSLAPDNIAHMFAGTAALNLPLRTRLTGTFSYSLWRQDQQFIPVTSNAAIMGALTQADRDALASVPKSLDAKAGTSVINLTATTRPFTTLTFSGRYRFYEFRDEAAVHTMPLFILGDRSVSRNSSLVERDPFNRTSGDASVIWRAIPSVSVIAGMEYEAMKLELEERNAEEYSEKTPRLGVDFTGLPWLTLRTMYTKGWRENGGYHQTDSIFVNSFRRFDLNSRTRERLTMIAEVTPLDEVSISGTWKLGRDAYPDSVVSERVPETSYIPPSTPQASYGVQSDRSAMVGADIEWTPLNRFTVGAGYSREEFKNRMRARYRTPTNLNNTSYDWVANNRDLITVVSANFDAILLPNKLEAGGTYELSKSKFVMATVNPTTPTGGSTGDIASATAYNLPEVTQKLQPVNVFLRYKLTPDWAATIRYQSELFGQNDFRTLGTSSGGVVRTGDGLQPGFGNHVFLGNSLQGYDAHFVTLTLTWRPGAIKLGRSTL